MSDINNATVCGRLVRDPEIRSNGNSWATFTVAANNRWKEREEVAFIPCIVFGPVADWCKEHRKGEQVIVSGRLRTSSWERDGQQHSRLELVVDQIQFLSRSSVSTNGAKREADLMPEEVKKAVPF